MGAMKAQSKSPTERPTELRPMTRKDIPQLLEIERASFRTPWDENRFLEAVDSRSGFKCVVLEDDSRVLGYFIVEIHARTLHISNLAVHPRHRRHGHASQCLSAIEMLALKAFEIARSREPLALQPVSKPASKSARATSERNSETESVGEGEIYLEVVEFLTATERVRDVSGTESRYEFTTPRPFYWHDGTSSCSERHGVGLGVVNSDLTSTPLTSNI